MLLLCGSFAIAVMSQQGTSWNCEFVVKHSRQERALEILRERYARGEIKY
jgi:uncharacterized membrane protein